MSTPNNNIDTDEPYSPATPGSVDDTTEETATTKLSTTDTNESRSYIEIRPSETALSPQTIARAMDLLCSLLSDATKNGVLQTLTRSVERPLVEWLLVSDGHTDGSIRYLVGTTDEDLLDDLEGILWTCFPNTYELQRVDWHPRDVVEQLPMPVANLQSGNPETHPEREAIESSSAEPYIAGVEYRGAGKGRHDWLCPLTPFESFIQASTRQPAASSKPDARDGDTRRVPLATLIETLHHTDVPVIFQTVCRPYGDQTAPADEYIFDLERGEGSFGSKIFETISPRSEEDIRAYEPIDTDQARIDGIRDRTLRRSFCLSTRAVALTHETPQQADSAADRLGRVFGHLSGDHHEITARIATDDELHPPRGNPPGTQLFEDLCERTISDVSYETMRNHLPGVPHESAGIVVAPEELPNFCLLDGGRLTPNGQRALAARTAERTGIRLPPPQQLARYKPPGMTFCMPLTQDRRPYSHSFALKPSHQNRHILVVGDTGAGKTVLMGGGIRTNVAATDGPEIIFDTKGGGTAEEYLRTHYAEYGNLDDVLYFDLTEVLPALTFFDIEPLLDAGIPREEARSRVAGHYEEILAGVMGTERFGRAVDSPKVIRNHIKALFDPIHGDEAFSHADLYDALRRTQEQHATPPVSDDRYTGYFESLIERDRDVFKKVLGGAIGRVDEIATDSRLGPIFEYVPDPDAETVETDAIEADPCFDFSDVVNEDKVVIFDFGGMEDRVKRTLTLVLLSNLWSALKAREHDPETPETPPLVNLYLEEAADVADTSLVDTLLSQGRSFNLSVTLGVQFARQLASADPENDTYLETLNETATFVVGNVTVDDELTKALATEAMGPQEVARRLSGMRRGEWLVRPATDFGEPLPRPFLAESLPAPPGHPASDDPLTGTDAALFEAAFEQVQSETFLDAGLAQADSMFAGSEDESEAEMTDEDAEEDSISMEDTEHPAVRVDTLLPHTKRLPKFIEYDDSMHALQCSRCENRYDPAIEGMVRAIECCFSMDRADRDTIPVCEFNLKLSPAEIEDSEWSISQLLFLQAVYNAQQLRYDRLEYDIVYDSMIRLQEYVGIEPEEIQDLIEADVLRRDGDHPHRLYSVSPDGRSVIGEAYREGIDYGHGVGDLEESSQHVCLIEAARRYLIQEYKENPDSAVVTVHPYYELDDGHRLDCAGLDAEGNVVVTVEAERINNDRSTAVLEDFDKMASCDPEEAIWVVLKRQDGHDVLETLYNPNEGEPRVEKTYSRNTPPQQFKLEAAGATAIYPVTHVQKELEDH